jgi:hypothetical protein
MAVAIQLENGETNFHDGEEGLHCYTVSDAGVLRVIRQTVNEWTVLFEYSPAGWLAVQGTRYMGHKLDKMAGADGTRKESSGAATATIL